MYLTVDLAVVSEFPEISITLFTPDTEMDEQATAPALVTLKYVEAISISSAVSAIVLPFRLIWSALICTLDPAELIFATIEAAVTAPFAPTFLTIALTEADALSAVVLTDATFCVSVLICPETSLSSSVTLCAASSAEAAASSALVSTAAKLVFTVFISPSICPVSVSSPVIA